MHNAMPVDDIRAGIKKAKDSSPLAAAEVTLLAAGKGQPASLIREAIDAGITDFGENRVQEAYGKWPEIKKRHPHVRLHLIGPLQTNKVKQALALFDVIQTVDRPKLAEAIARELGRGSGESGIRGIREKENTIPCTPESLNPQFLVQINTGNEPQKAGVIPEEADALIGYCRDQLRLSIAGLMCIPPAGQPPAPHFALLRQIALRHGLPELSMGMSDDFETAVRMGSTCVRIGRALFGQRS